MPRWRFWEREDQERPQRLASPGPATQHPPRWPILTSTDPATRQRLDQLRKRREPLAFDVERAEAARLPDNPWRERIALLDESLATVETDLAALDNLPPEPTFPLPETPIVDIEATTGEPASIRFRIGPETFDFEEETDWDQRGGPVVRGELRRRTGDAANLVPAETPSDRRDALAAHLSDSIVVFATDLRDRALDAESLPANPTLADLARPCPDCGGWRDWRGACAVCAQRAWRRQQLSAEAQRLAQERDEEEEERAKWAERLPVARRRLADLDAEIARLEAG